MSMFTEQEAKAILDKVIALSKADECTAQLTGIDRRQHPLSRSTTSPPAASSTTPIWPCRSPSASASAPPRSTSSTTPRWNASCAAPKTWPGWRRRIPEFMPAIGQAELQAEPDLQSQRPPRSRRNTAPRSPPTRIEPVPQATSWSPPASSTTASASPRSPTARATSATRRPPTLDLHLHRAHRRRPRLGLGRPQSRRRRRRSTPTSDIAHRHRTRRAIRPRPRRSNPASTP